MSSPEGWADALDGFRRAWRGDRLAHAYLVAGPSRADAAAFAATLLAHVFCTGGPPRPCGECPGCRQAHARRHPDALWIEPESKSRQITIERIRETLLPRIHQTPFVENGWRAAVLLDAECLNEPAANALLKTLEEPPPKTLLLLVTASPRQLPPTVVSRCHRLLAAGTTAPDSPWRERTLALLEEPDPPGVVERWGRVRAFRDLIEEARTAAREEVEALEDAAPEDPNTVETDSDVLDARINARVLAVRREILETLLLWQRDLWVLAQGHAGPLRFPAREAALRAQAGRYTPAAAADALRGVEALQRRVERNLPAEPALAAFFLGRPGGAA